MGALVKHRTKPNEVVESGRLGIILRCPVCGKTFIKEPASIYTGKVGSGKKKGTIIYYCTYTCWRADGADGDGVIKSKLKSDVIYLSPEQIEKRRENNLKYKRLSKEKKKLNLAKQNT